MSRQLYERWLIEGEGATLSEFVAAERARWWQYRAQRRWAAHMGPLMAQAPPQMVLQQQMGLQNAPLGMYRGMPLGGIGNLLGGLFTRLQRP